MTCRPFNVNSDQLGRDLTWKLCPETSKLWSLWSMIKAVCHLDGHKHENFHLGIWSKIYTRIAKCAARRAEYYISEGLSFETSGYQMFSHPKHFVYSFTRTPAMAKCGKMSMWRDKYEYVMWRDQPADKIIFLIYGIAWCVIRRRPETTALPHLNLKSAILGI